MAVLGVVNDIGGVHEAFARQTGGVGTRATQPAALDHGAVLTGFGGEGPSDEFACFAATEDEDVVMVWVWVRGCHIGLFCNCCNLN